MKVHTVDQDVSVGGNFAKSDFAVGDISFILDMFADKVYSNKEKAVVREISCNAYDSHVVADNPNPFDVHLPTILEPWFSVRDYGTGLSDSGIRNTYAGIGISTKRENNKLIGCMGIGSLSPYALVDSFMVKSYHGGFLRTYSMYRDERRNPIVALLSEEPTDEPVGLEVSLCVDGKVSDFERAAASVFEYWDSIPNINSQYVMDEINRMKSSFIISDNDFALTSEYGGMKAVMGNVAYDIPYEYDSINLTGYVKFDLGEISFNTGRESLSLDDRTRKAIKDKMLKVRELAKTKTIESIKQQPTAFKRAREAEAMSGIRLRFLNAGDFDQFELPLASKPIESYTGSRRSSWYSPSCKLNLGKSTEYYNFKPKMTARVRAYARDMNKTIVLLADLQIQECLIDADVIQDVDTIPKIKRSPRISSGQSARRVGVAMLQRSNSIYRDILIEATVTLDGLEKIYVPTHRGRCSGPFMGYSGTVGKLFIELEKIGITIPQVYGLNAQYLKSRHFKGNKWITLKDYVQREIDKTGILFYNGNMERVAIMSELHELIDNEDLKEWKKLFDVCNTTLFDTLNRNGVTVSLDDALKKWQDAYLEKYSMLEVVGTIRVDCFKSNIAKYIGGTIIK